MFTEVQTQIEAIAALAAMIDARTLAGQAVLKAVQHDLAAAYEKLATYLRRHEGAPM